jgi:hypothetical protein
VEQATERFKLIAEAFSVLQDPQLRATYDFCGDAGVTTGEGVNIGGARDLFCEVFGSEFTDKLSQAAGVVADGLEKVAGDAAPYVKYAASAGALGLKKAVEHVGRVSIVREAVVCGLNSITDADEKIIEQKRIEEIRCKESLDDCIAEHEERAEQLAIVYRQRRERDRRSSWWNAVHEKFTGAQRAKDEAFDRKVAKSTLKHQDKIRMFEREWLNAKRDLEDAEAVVSHAKQVQKHVQCNGPSYDQALKIGTCLLDHFSQKVCKEMLG